MNKTSSDRNSKKGPVWLSAVEAEVEGLYQLERVICAVFARGDGLPLAIVPGGGSEETSLAATLAALHDTSKMAMQQADGGAFTEALVRGERTILAPRNSRTGPGEGF